MPPTGKFTQTPSDNQVEPRKKSAVKAVSGEAVGPGIITKTIGSGTDANNSFVWITIRWSFILGGLTTLAIYIRPFWFPSQEPLSLIEDIKSAWSIFMPIITLALGYALGKNK